MHLPKPSQGKYLCQMMLKQVQDKSFTSPGSMIECLLIYRLLVSHTSDSWFKRYFLIADVAERESSPAALHDKILSCITACIYVARIDDIIKEQKNFIDLYLLSLSPSFPWTGAFNLHSPFLCK